VPNIFSQPKQENPLLVDMTISLPSYYPGVKFIPEKSIFFERQTLHCVCTKNEFRAQKFQLIYLVNGPSGDHDNLAPLLLPRSKGYPREKYIFRDANFL
jgi:hypothetical protein